jgi:hypothetical protein
MTALLEMEPFVDQCSSIFQTRLGEFADQKTTFDLGHWLQCYAFDVVGEITFAKRFGFLDAGEDPKGLMNGIEAYLSYGSKVGMVPELHYPLMRFMEIISRGQQGGPLAPVIEVTPPLTLSDCAVQRGACSRTKGLQNRSSRFPFSIP